MSEDLIVPDTKDWTWTTQHRCQECAFDASGVAATELPGHLSALTAPWPEVLSHSEVRQRPEPTTWSPLEYGCHIHEVLDVFARRFELILAQDQPTLPTWDQDAASLEGDYARQDPLTIAEEIPGRTAALLAVLARFDGDRGPASVQDPYEKAGTAYETPTLLWGRGARRSDGAEFTSLSLARYLVHDLAHHLHDVGAGDRIPASSGKGTGDRIPASGGTDA